MPHFRRSIIPGGTFFFTVVTDRRRPLFGVETARDIVGDCFRECRARWPFEIPAIVLLPDHLHAIWSLPRGDDAYPTRWSWIKKEFTKRWLASGHDETTISEARHRERRRGVWQPRFWEHTIEEDEDLERHMDYIHYNPVKHGYAPCPHAWPFSSFHRWVKAGAYPWHWACWEGGRKALEFKEINKTVGE